ncbi:MULTISPECIES: DNA-binding protein [unclassified Guyparkeria]|uniref:YobI family P-loop NTPase n=1 Tax=unclassified Guyparkeria TaxID=2626246 RepID=UPI000AFDBAE8|nr:MULTISPECIES: DNA-binding protein [unclassified Guyparkeria]
MTEANSQRDERKPWELLPLTPKYISKEHDFYVRAINHALKNPDVKNIALSGNFGVGKSSILRKVADQNRKNVVELSLSTLAPAQQPKNESDEFGREQNEYDKTPTNIIQKEIVKQLLYRLDPSSAPGSRFRRIDRFRFGREFVLSLVVGLLVAVLSLLAGTTEKLAVEFVSVLDIGLWWHVAVLGVVTSVTLLLRWLLFGRLHVRQISAGAAAVTLDETSTSYFDQYLDEIVHFFDASTYDIVILEDIDRFNNSRIFETLLSLNTLLNSLPSRRDRPIRFVYAMKDSIFDQLGLQKEGRGLGGDVDPIGDASKAEAVRANRTKFFDLVIPVVPFITHESARDLIRQLLDEVAPEVSMGVVDLASRYLPDMRLLKNARNEFVVFCDRIRLGQPGGLDLNKTELFAMMLYKSSHLADFERIRTGDSKLDEIYKASRDLVRENMVELNEKLRGVRNTLFHLDDSASRSEELGDQLLSYIERVVRASPYTIANNHHYIYDGTAVDEDYFRSPEFWSDFSSDGGNPEVVLRINASNIQFAFNREDLKEDLGDIFDPEGWVESERSRLIDLISQYKKRLDFLRGADVGDLINGPDFKVSHNTSDKTLKSIAKDVFPDGLAYELLSNGYINRNFTLYTSPYHGRIISENAKRFIIHSFDRGVMDEQFELSGDDVEAVVCEVGQRHLNDPALYNIDIMDHLLRSSHSGAELMLGSLSAFGDVQRRFIQSYLEGGEEKELFVSQFASVAPRVLVHLVEDLELAEDERALLLDVVFRNLSDRVDYEVDGFVSKYLSQNYRLLPVLSVGEVDGSQIYRVASIFSKAKARVDDLGSLSDAVRRVFVEKVLYEINLNNLRQIVGSETPLGLDVIEKRDEKAYRACLHNLSDYLAAIKNKSETVTDPESFVDVINDVMGAESRFVSDVVSGASEKCSLQDLEEVDEDVWPHLAYSQRFAPSFHNVRAYLGVFGVDQMLGDLLSSAGKITVQEGADEGEKESVACELLSSEGVLPSASMRAQLVASLGVQLDVETVPVSEEGGELFAWLLKYDVINDDARAYARLAGFEWPVKEMFIKQSSRFSDYVVPDLVQGDLSNLLLRKNAGRKLKDAILDEVSGYVAVATREDLVALAKVAAQRRRELPADVLEVMAREVPPKLIVNLLQPKLQAIDTEQLLRILGFLGLPYESLARSDEAEVTIPASKGAQAIVSTLEERGVVASFEQEGSHMRVKMVEE